MYSKYENKVKANLEHRIDSWAASRFRRVVVPTEQVIETKDGQKVQIEKRIPPGYVLVNITSTTTAGQPVNTPGVTGFAGPGGKPVRWRSPTSTGCCTRAPRATVRARARVHPRRVGQVTPGPLSDFDGEIVEVNPGSRS
jgi:transcriptional antiterminator NusG